MVALGRPVNRPEMVAFMVLTQALVLRAALIPSTARRTVILGVASSLPLLLGTWLLHAGPDRPAHLPSAGGVVVTAMLWLSMTVATTGVISFIIYGLQERVRAAMKLGQYTLEEKLGEGGMGEVYRARHALLRRPTAIKLLLAGNENQIALSRFEREVQITAGLSHPNIVAVYDFGRAADGRFYYAMEYLDGIDLEQVLRHDGPQPPGRVRMILTQAADALAEAHDAGLIHRDIKPANMILCQRARRAEVVKLVDFGLVKETSNALAAQSGVASLKGTPLYLSPESIADPDAVDARSDLYALGAVAYFLLTGRVVFDGESVFEVCAGHLHKQPVPPSQVTDKPIPPSLESIVLRCLAKAPEDRPQTAMDLLKALRDCTDTPSWGPEESAHWWQECAPAVRAQMKRRDPITGKSQLMIDPGGRS
jgi:serine/threonine protein kinase